MKRTFSVILLALLLASILPFGLNTQVALASATIYIRWDGSIDPPTAPITTLDKITYTLSDNINASIVVERDTIVIDGVGYTIQGVGTETGIDLSGRTNVTVKNTQIKSFECGIRLDHSWSNSISGNKISDNTYGIVLEQCFADNTIRGNDMTANSIGIMVGSSSDSIIYSNNFIDNAEQVSTHASTNIWNDDYPYGGNYWSDYIGVDERSGPDQDLPGGDGIGDVPYIIDADNRDHHPLMEPVSVRPWEYGVCHAFPLNIVFVGFEEEVVDTATIDANIQKGRRRPYRQYDVGYGFDVNYHFADTAYYDALETFVLENSGMDMTSALDVAALETQKQTGERMSIFTDQSGWAINATAVEDWFAANPFQPDLEPAYWFYIMDFTELDLPEPDLEHWYTVEEWDFEANRLRDFWRLEWDNPLNPDVGFPYPAFTSQSRVFFIDPSAHQWYLTWAKIWWGLTETGPKYEYYESNLAEFLDEHDVNTPEGRTALAYYLAGWIEDGLMNLLAPNLYTSVDLSTAESVSVQTLILNNSSDAGYDNETMKWIVDPELYEYAISDLAPWIDVEVVFDFVCLEDYPELQAIFEDAVIEVDDGWTYYDGLEVWFGLIGVRESYFDFTAADIVVNGYVYLEKDMSMWYGGEFTGLGGSGQLLVMKEVGRYFEENGVTPKTGLGKVFIHEAGHNLGLPHTFSPHAHAGDFAFDVMGYYPHSYFVTQLWKDCFRRLVVDLRLLALQERLDKIAVVYERRTPDAAIDAEFNELYLGIGEVLQLYEELRFLEALDKTVQAEDSVINLEGLVLEYLVDTTAATIEGQTREVNCEVLPAVTLTLYLDDDEMRSTVSDEDGYYTLAVPGPGEYTVVADKAGFRVETQTITVDDTTTHTVDFVGSHGLTPNAPTIGYVGLCIAKWREGELTIGRVGQVIAAWRSPDVTVFKHSGKGQVNTPPFEVGSSPWLLYFSTDWNGHFAVSLRNGGYHGLVTNQSVSAGEVYETYVYGYTGSLYFTIESAPSDGQWTLEVIENPSPPVPSPGTIFTYSGKGQVNTPPFEVSSSPWKLQYTADWNGHFAVQVKNDGIELVINHAVSAGEVYETYVYGWTGSLHFHIQSAPSDGEWTLWVTEVP